MNSANILLISQNVMLDSLANVKEKFTADIPLVIVSTQLLFRNEREYITSILGEFTAYTFAELLTDSEMEQCDTEAYLGNSEALQNYYARIKTLKNRLIIRKLDSMYECAAKIIVCDDLGIDASVWLEAGYEFVKCRYFHEEQPAPKLRSSIFRRISSFLRKSVYSAEYLGTKYVFYGLMHRIAYRMALDFKPDRTRNIYSLFSLVARKLTGITLQRRSKAIHISTLHEAGNLPMKALSGCKVRLIQDGYLPPNYSSLYLKFIPDNVVYYVWDVLGMQTFINQNIPVELLPFRKKLYMPEIKPVKLRTVLIAASGAGDWTAVKNRSDDDKMLEAFGDIAARFPDVKFIYRCHPTWVHPAHQGVNSINRAIEYFAYLNLPNLTISANIPHNDINHFRLSFSRSSLDEDMKSADIVFGEHSVSMIDAAMKGIPFASVNLTGRRNFFCGMTELGFPHCESIDEVIRILEECESSKFVEKFNSAVKRYNAMTDQEK